LLIVANLLTSPDCSESFETPWVVLLFLKTLEKSTGNADNSELLNILKSIQDNQKKQDD
jgi:hypothetical protein